MSDKLCPDCGHPVNEHTYDGCGYEPAVFCKCLRTRNQAMQEKDYCTSEWRGYNCLDKETCPTLSDSSICTHYKQPPADLQPEKHCTHPEVKDKADCWYGKQGKCEGCSDLQPMPTMPLIELTPSDLKEANSEGCWNTECSEYTGENKRLCKELLEDGECEDRYQFSDHDSEIAVIATLKQRDADMAWHKEQVAAVAKQVVKQFAEKVISEVSGRVMTKEWTAHIRAMAEKE